MLRGQEQLGFGCGTVTSTVDAPTGVCATAVSKSIMLCCSSGAGGQQSYGMTAAPMLYVSGPALAAVSYTHLTLPTILLV